MMQPAFRPFLFDRCFDDPVEETAVSDELPLAITYSEEDLARARTEGFIEGKRFAETQTAESLELRVAVASECIAESIAHLCGTLPTRDAILSDLTALSVALVGRFLSSRRQTDAAEEIATLIQTMLPEVVDQPRLVVRLAPGIAAALEARLAALAAQQGFAGEFIVRSDETMETPDCRMEWQGGGVMRNTRQIWARIEARLGELVDTCPDVAAATVDNASNVDKPLTPNTPANPLLQDGEN